MDAETIVKILTAVATFLVATLIPSIIAMVKKWKQAKAATTEAEKEAIRNDMTDIAISLIAAAEKKYKELDTLIKSQGGVGCGADKKDDVMTKLQLSCNEKGIAFDAEYWSAKIDEIVAMTKQVNAKEAAKETPVETQETKGEQANGEV